MSEENKYVQLLEEVLDGIDKGDFADAYNIPSKYRYEHMLALFM